jgi:carboxyl-terminal processing protease
MLLLGIFIGSVSTGGIDVLKNSTGEQPIASNQSLPDNLNYKEVEEVYDSLRKNFDGELSLEDLQTGMKRGLVEASGDPYTTYFTTEESEEFNGEVNGTFSGIGAELIKENGVIVVTTPLSGFPAEKAGIQARDVIIKIDDEDSTGITVAEAVKRIRGEKGTTVKLTVYREDKQLEFSIVRDTITIPSVTSEVKDGIGILTITRFGDDTAELSRQAANKFLAENVSGVVVDLRNNPGGYLNQAVDVASIWAPKGSKIVEEKRDGKTIKIDKTVSSPLLESKPTVVIINGGSASASEILAGALKDLGLATLVGEKSFGKGSVQQIDALDGGSALKVTIAKWFTPLGVNINKDGIQPDVEVKPSAEDITNKVDAQLNTAIKKLSE